MYKVTKDKSKVIDYQNKIVGYIKNERFTQYGCDPLYRNGLNPSELEKISEVMQRNNIGNIN